MTTVGTIFDIKRYALHDGPGIRTTVFFKGCPLGCAWCHNPESREPEPQLVRVQRPTAGADPAVARERWIGRQVSAQAVIEELLQDEVFYDQSGGGVTFSGGEPMMQLDFLQALLLGCRRHRLHTALDTSGFAPWEDFERIREKVELFLFDLKPVDDKLHRHYTGVSNVSIHSNLKALAEAGSRVTVRIPLIPDVTDTIENLEAAAALLLPWPGLHRIDLLPYNRLGEDKIERYGLGCRPFGALPPPDESVEAARDLLRERGFDVKIGG